MLPKSIFGCVLQVILLKAFIIDFPNNYFVYIEKDGSMASLQFKLMAQKGIRFALIAI